MLMKKVYYLKTCDTCKRIMKELNLEEFQLREIKSKPITESEIEDLRKQVDTYEQLLNKRSRKYSEIKNKNLSDQDLKQAILEEYTFLKRPIFQVDEKLFIGNSKATVAAVQQELT